MEPLEMLDHCNHLLGRIEKLWKMAVYRDNGYVISFGSALGKTALEVDQIFSMARVYDLPQ